MPPCFKTANQGRPWPRQALFWFRASVSVGRTNTLLKTLHFKRFYPGSAPPRGAPHQVGRGKQAMAGTSRRKASAKSSLLLLLSEKTNEELICGHGDTGSSPPRVGLRPWADPLIPRWWRDRRACAPAATWSGLAPRTASEPWARSSPSSSPWNYPAGSSCGGGRADTPSDGGAVNSSWASSQSLAS